VIESSVGAGALTRNSAMSGAAKGTLTDPLSTFTVRTVCAAARSIGRHSAATTRQPSSSRASRHAKRCALASPGRSAASGFADDVSAIGAAWKARDVAAAERAVSDRMADAVTLVGDRARCRARLDAFRAAGAGSAIVFVNAVGEPRAAAVERALTALAPTG